MTVASNSPINWQAALLSEGASIEQAIRRLNDAALQIVMVVNPQGQLVGTITDGDIRRALLRGLTVADTTDDILARQALVVPPDMRPESVMQLMRANRIHQLPVVDDQCRVVGLHLWDEISGPSERPNLMVIMAGGLGTRLAPHTETCPKPLLPVAGKPMLEHIIERAKDEGFSRFVLSVRYLGQMIEEHFGDGRRWGVRIDYLRENDPLGTAGALSLLTPQPDLPFIVTNGDVLTDIRYGEMLDFHVRNHAHATMAVRMYEWQHPFGVVHTEGVNIVGFEEKPVHRSHVNAGVYALNPSALDALRSGERCDMPTLFEAVRAQSGRTVVYPMHEPWLDVGRPSDYAEAARTLGEHAATDAATNFRKKDQT
jgi:dTDP-glucose pyrophosphorylase